MLQPGFIYYDRDWDLLACEWLQCNGEGFDIPTTAQYEHVDQHCPNVDDSYMQHPSGYIFSETLWSTGVIRPISSPLPRTKAVLSPKKNIGSPQQNKKAQKKRKAADVSVEEETPKKLSAKTTKPERSVATAAKVDKVDKFVAPSTPPNKKRYICTRANCEAEAVYCESESARRPAYCDRHKLKSTTLVWAKLKKRQPDPPKSEIARKSDSEQSDSHTVSEDDKIYDSDL